MPGVGTATAEGVWSAFLARRRHGAGTVDELLAPDVASHVPPKGRAGYRGSRSSSRALARKPTCDLPAEAIEKVLEGGYEEYLRPSS